VFAKTGIKNEKFDIPEQSKMLICFAKFMK